MTTAGRPRTCFAPARKSPGTARCSWGELVRLYRSAQPALPSAAPPPPPHFLSQSERSLKCPGAGRSQILDAGLSQMRVGGWRASLKYRQFETDLGFYSDYHCQECGTKLGHKLLPRGGIKGAKQEKKRRGLRRPMRMHQLSPDLLIPSLPGNAYTDWF